MDQTGDEAARGVLRRLDDTVTAAKRQRRAERKAVEAALAPDLVRIETLRFRAITTLLVQDALDFLADPTAQADGYFMASLPWQYGDVALHDRIEAWLGPWLAQRGWTLVAIEDEEHGEQMRIDVERRTT